MNKIVAPETTSAYINAGGRGTRLNDLFAPDPELGIAKALLLLGKPPLRLIDHHIGVLRSINLASIIVGAGDHPKVASYIAAGYADQNIHVSITSTQLGTGGELLYALHSKPEYFSLNTLVCNVDTILDISYEEFLRSQSAQALATIALTRTSGVPNQDAFWIGDRSKVVRNDESGTVSQEPTDTKYRASSTGSVLLRTDFLQTIDWSPGDGQLSLYKDILAEAEQRDGLYAYDNSLRFFRDIGTHAAWLASQNDDELQSLLCYDVDYRKKEARG